MSSLSLFHSFKGSDGDEDLQPHIHIQYDGRIEDVLAGSVKEYAIMAEGEIVARTDDVLKAVCGVMAVHYIII